VEQLKRLKLLLIQNPGESSVTLVFEGSDKKMKLPFKISWTPDLARQISSVIEPSA
jgi:hypothetical protein